MLDIKDEDYRPDEEHLKQTYVTDNQLVKKISKYTINDIALLMTNKKYAFFSKGEYNLNIIGVRASDTTVNEFNDALILVYKVEKENFMFVYNFTTDPGLYWLKNPMTPYGAAILVPGQYRGVYKLAKHRNKYMALCQLGGNVNVYRDGNKDNRYDYNAKTIQSGMFGINIHRSHPLTHAELIDKHSAGCQVFQNVVNFNHLMNVANKALTLYPNSFTYTLIEEKDLPKI